MKKIKKLLNKNMSIISVALSNVEKNALSQTNEGLATDINQSTRLNQGKLSDSLINSEVTQEVMDLRWRMYKVMEADDKLTITLNGRDKDGNPIYSIKGKEFKIEKPMVDSVDPYQLQMVVDNTEIVTSQGDMFDMLSVDESVNGLDYFTKAKNQKPINIIRNSTPNFYIEDFTKVLKIRKIDDEKSMIEFHVSIYPDEYNRKSRLFISAIKKQLENPLLNASMLDIEEISFVTNKTLGSSNNLLFEYNNLMFDKIITYNGHYVIKFIGNIKTNGEYIMAKYFQDILEEKYKNKEKK